MYITERMIDAHGPTDSCRKCSTRKGNHSAECRQRFEKIQYDLLQGKLGQAPAIPQDTGEQTVVTPPPVASDAEPGLAASSSAPSSSFTQGQTCARLDIAGGFGRHCTELAWHLLDGRPQACGLPGAVDEEARW